MAENYVYGFHSCPVSGSWVNFMNQIICEISQFFLKNKNNQSFLLCSYFLCVPSYSDVLISSLLLEVEMSNMATLHIVFR